ncbi:MAG TPA: DUF1203 domain-containing protein [Caulobacteraceae bacterium]
MGGNKMDCHRNSGPFAPLFDLDDEALLARGVHRFVADEPHSAPCRISLEDAEPGERLLLMAYEHQPAASPFRASGPIFVREQAGDPFDGVDVVPPALVRRTLSARAYDARAMMVKGRVVAGAEAATLLTAWFLEDEVAEIHLHYAARGCFAARAVRA